MTVIGISLCMILMLFLFGIYEGVSQGSVEYIRENKSDFWVLHRNSTNILRGTSILPADLEDSLKQIESIDEASPVLLIITTVKNSSRHATIFLAGYDISTGMGGPPKLAKGSNVLNENEIVLDESFAQSNGFDVGDHVVILDDTLTVTGLSNGTNAFVIQYAFTTLSKAQSLLGMSGTVTCYLVKIKHEADSAQTKLDIESKISGSVAFNHSQFLSNNIREMESGFLPILFAVAAIGAIVLTTVLSLILSINILERKKDFAVMKILGSPSYFLPALIIRQAVFISLASGLLCALLIIPVTNLVERISPEVSTVTTINQVIIVLSIGILMGLISSAIALGRLRKIYPLEVFYGKS